MKKTKIFETITITFVVIFCVTALVISVLSLTKTEEYGNQLAYDDAILVTGASTVMDETNSTLTPVVTAEIQLTPRMVASFQKTHLSYSAPMMIMISLFLFLPANTKSFMIWRRVV